MEFTARKETFFFLIFKNSWVPFYGIIVKIKSSMNMKRYSRSNMKKSKLQNIYCLILVFALKTLVGAQKICGGI